ncbi:MAG: glycosyltransferase [Candidatus Moranbacteria bacterium]|nr:glycosyltransferase [Candidatus Moranbacteria bacterium]
MIEKVEDSQITERKIKSYKHFMKPELWSEIQMLAVKLKGKKIIHVNTTSHRGGGGVAEILHSLVPLMQDAGLEVEWWKIRPGHDFFEVTKNIHNTLQGDKVDLTPAEKKLYLAESKKLARDFEALSADTWIIHDPQPLLLPHFAKNIQPAILRLHIDLSKPNQKTWKFLQPFLDEYKRIIFSRHEYVFPGFSSKKAEVFSPAIDPLTAKNEPMKKEAARMILENLGMNPEKLIVAQVSRFDVWKDPLGVIRAYYLAKKEIPNLQLVLVGLTLAADDPEAREVYEKVKKYARGDADIFAFYNPRELQYDNNTLINAVQTGSDVIIQKSLKEGFGLTVTEAMWKKKAVIGGNVGGIKLQIRNGFNGYLVDSEEECAERIVKILKDKKLASLLGKRAKESVQEHFLAPRLLRDYLKLIAETISARKV